MSELLVVALLILKAWLRLALPANTYNADKKKGLEFSRRLILIKNGNLTAVPEWLLLERSLVLECTDDIDWFSRLEGCPGVCEFEYEEDAEVDMAYTPYEILTCAMDWSSTLG